MDSECSLCSIHKWPSADRSLCPECAFLVGLGFGRSLIHLRHYHPKALSYENVLMRVRRASAAGVVRSLPGFGN
jgi:hypothetical protein